MPTRTHPTDRASRHGCVLRVGGAVALSGAQRPAGRDRRRPPASADNRRPIPSRGRPVRTFATLRHYAGRGVITTATYEARAFGLHSAMGLMKAAQLAPETVLLPVDFDAYRKYSRLFKDAVRAIAPRIQDNGIDEIYVDLTDVHPQETGTDVREAGARSVGTRPRSSRGRSRTPFARRPGFPVRSASRRTSSWRRSPPSSTSRTA